MKEKNKEYFEAYHEILDSQKFTASSLDYTILHNYFPLLDNLDKIGSSAISVFDMYKRDHVYFSDKHSSLFGWDVARARKEGVKYTNTLLHPKDEEQLVPAGIYFLKMVMEIPSDQRKDYKLWTEYRVMNGEGNYIRVIEQQMFLENDQDNNLWLALCLMDLSPNQQEDTPFLCRAVNTRTGRLYYFPPEELKSQSHLSKREIEILKLISKGLVSKQIADKLFISVNTVNTHRQRIIEKLGVSNTAEAIQFLRSLGLIQN